MCLFYAYGLSAIMVLPRLWSCCFAYFFHFANGFDTIFIKSMHQENEFSDVRLAMHALCQSLQRDGALANVDLIKLTAFAIFSNFAFESNFTFESNFAFESVFAMLSNFVISNARHLPYARHMPYARHTFNRKSICAKNDMSELSKSAPPLSRLYHSQN